MFKGNMSKLLKQAQDVQQQIEKVQSQLSDMIIESESGGGMVKVKVNGKQEVLELCSSLHRLLDGPHHVEGLLRQLVKLTRQNAFEACDGVLQ